MSKKAFTIIEMLVTVAILSTITLILAFMFTNGEKQYRVGSKMIAQNEKASFAVRDFEKITRGATSIIGAEPTSLTFLSYLKGDSHPAPTKINYYLEGGIFYRSMISPVISDGLVEYPEANKTIQVIANNVISGQLFSYFNDSNIELAFPIQNDVVRMIKLSLKVDEDQAASPEEAEQSTAVQLRNLKNNL